MDVTNPLYARSRSQWREWLSRNFDTADEVWLVYPTKASGEAGIPYNDAVEEALCFGWIDSTQKRIDDLHRAQRFTPRRAGSPYSQPNIERLRWLDSQGLIHESVRPSVEGLLTAEFEFPEDILDALRRDKATWDNFMSFSGPYRRIRVAYVEAARRRPDEFQKRLGNLVKKTGEGKLIVGYGGIDKYYGHA